ncbi:MAG: geranylgeranylglyceryl/heptaprenylglyceryl phosphate synthase [Candidatus Marinimicrobia bacterium]|nr:geranylgeranylglyceryl/heptaprenylglyceryl phosphate synthase [Candidatus Neomarinimicrobiota bacterium]
MNTYSQLEKLLSAKRCGAFALIDPDIKNDSILLETVDKINESGFDAILVGGSLLQDNNFDTRINQIKKNTELPVIIFPGSSKQLSGKADAILFLSLLSGRNPQYLIGEHVESAPVIHSLGLEPIPTGYILLDGGSRTSVEIISNTIPLPMNKVDIILAHALAGQYLGNKFIFLECGSGASNHASTAIVNALSSRLDIPIIVGGGITSAESANAISKAGASFIVVGTHIENGASVEQLKEITTAI